MKGVFTILTSVIILCALPLPAQDGYICVDLGTLGGRNSRALAINGSGTVTGYAETADDYLRAFIYSGGSMTDLGTLGGRHSFGYEINASGTVVGYAWLDDSGTLYHGFRYAGGVMTDLGTLGGSRSRAFDINAGGTIVGDSENASGDEHAFIWAGGSMTDIGTLGGTESGASGINAGGTIVGSSETAGGETHAFLYSGGSMTDLGTLGGTESFALAINADGVVIGQALTAGDAEAHAFRYTAGGGMEDLGTFGGTESWALGLNDAGDIVGSSRLAGEDEVWHAFLYRDSVMTDIHPDGWEHTHATDINENGIICGRGYSPSGEYRAFLLFPEQAFSFKVSGEYFWTDLGTLGSIYSWARGINDDGTIVGESWITGGVSRAFRWTEAGGMTDLGTLGGSESAAYAINPSGTIAGYAVVQDSPYVVHAFSYSGGVMTDLGTVGGSQSQGYAINSAGTVGGMSCRDAFCGGVHAMTYSGGSMTDIDTLFADSQTYGISDSGVAAGRGSYDGFTYRAFRHAGGVMTDLGTLGGSESEAHAINGSGTVVGHSHTAGDTAYHAFRWTESGGFEDLGVLLGTSSFARGINDVGTVVGYASTPKGYHAFRYEGGVLRDINPPGWANTQAMDINEDGWVAGFGYPPGSVYSHGLLLKPVGAADLDLDGAVGVEDLDILLQRWGVEDALADIDGSGGVDESDLGILLSSWYPPVEPGYRLADAVSVGEAGSEAAHNLQAAASSGTDVEAGYMRRYAGYGVDGAWFSYEFAVPAGVERFVLRFAETYPSTTNVRAYITYVDGESLFDAYNIFLPGYGTGFYHIEVSDAWVLTADGTLRVEFVADTPALHYDPSVAAVWLLVPTQ